MGIRVVYGSWQGQHGGKDPVSAYRRFVHSGVEQPPKNPLLGATEGWLLGSQAFVQRIKGLTKGPKYVDEVPKARRLGSVPLTEVLAAVADHYDVNASSFTITHSKEASRDIAAWLVRRITTATLRELSISFGLGHPDSVRNLIHRADQQMERSPTVRKQVDRNLRSLQLKTENRV